MFKIEIKNLQNIVTNLAQFSTEQQCLDWLNEVKLTGAFGKLEREVREIFPGILENNEDISKSVSSRQVEEFSQTITWHTLPQEFTHTITDETVLHQAQQESREALTYLNSTDWYVSRLVETGVPVPQNILDARAAARLKVL